MINKELEKLYYEDKKDKEINLSSDSITGDMAERDSIRLKRIYEMIEGNEIDESEIWNCHYIALLLQHGNTSQDFKLANEYAKKAVVMGSSVTKWLYAATLDRYLLSIGEKQKFGTQFDLSGDEPKLAPYDESTSDEEREKYCVPSIDNAVEEYKKKYK